MEMYQKQLTVRTIKYIKYSFNGQNWFMRSFTNWSSIFVCIFGLLLMGISSGCENEKENIDPSTYGYEYFPLKVGQYWIYQSDSIVLFSAGTIRDTSASLIREDVVDFFINENMDSIFIVNVSGKSLPDGEWTFQKKIFLSKDSHKALRQEGNLVFTKMVFPIRPSVRFDHNQYFDPTINIEIGGEVFNAMYDGWNTRIDNSSTPVLWLGQPVENVRIRYVDDNSTSLEKKLYYETYIKGVGLYKKQMIFLQDNKGGAQPIEERAIKGFYHDLILVEHN